MTQLIHFACLILSISIPAKTEFSGFTLQENMNHSDKMNTKTKKLLSCNFDTYHQS